MTKRLTLISVFLAVTLLASACCQTPRADGQEDANKELVKRIHAEGAKGNIAIFDEVLAENYVRHCQAMPPQFQELRDVAVFKEFLTEFYGSVSEFTDSVGPMIADGHFVSYVSTMTGRQTGPMGGLPPSGKEFTVVNIIMHRFEDGKIAESWVSWDNVAMLTQLGYFPPSPPPTKESEK